MDLKEWARQELNRPEVQEARRLNTIVCYAFGDPPMACPLKYPCRREHGCGHARVRKVIAEQARK